MVLGYTDTARVQQHLGRTFTSAQVQECQALIDAAEQWINARTGTAWAATTPLTEHQTLSGRLLYLERAPVAALSSVSVRPQLVGAASTALAAGAGYELLDPTLGLVLLTGSYDSDYAGWLATLVYTPAVPVDSRITLAATRLVGFWLRPLLDGVSGDVKSYSVGQELQVTYRDPGTGRVPGIPEDVLALVDQCRQVVFA